MRAAVAGSAALAERLLSAALAFFDYCRDNPGDLDLGFYLFRGMKPLGLTRELNADLNARLQAALGEVERALGDLALPPEAAERETAALFGHAVGLPLLVHTGRKRLFRLDGRELMADYVDRPGPRGWPPRKQRSDRVGGREARQYRPARSGRTPCFLKLFKDSRRRSAAAARGPIRAILIRPPALRRNEESKSHRRRLCFLRRSALWVVPRPRLAQSGRRRGGVPVRSRKCAQRLRVRTDGERRSARLSG